MMRRGWSKIAAIYQSLRVTTASMSAQNFKYPKRLKCDGTCAETRFCLSAKRTSPFKSARASVQSTTGNRGVHISGSNAGYTKFRVSEGYWLPPPFASFHFTSPPVRHRVPSRFNWTLPTCGIKLDWKWRVRLHSSQNIPMSFFFFNFQNREKMYYRVFSNLIRTSFCRFLKRKKKLVRGSNPHLSFNSPLRAAPSEVARWLSAAWKTIPESIIVRSCKNKQWFGRIRRWHSMGGRWWR